MQVSSNIKRRICWCCKKKRACNKFASDKIASCLQCTKIDNPVVQPIFRVNIDDKYALLRCQLKSFQENSRPCRMFRNFFTPEEIEAIRHDISGKKSVWEPINFDGKKNR
jgi:hypothetical protein